MTIYEYIFFSAVCIYKGMKFLDSSCNWQFLVNIVSLSVTRNASLRIAPSTDSHIVPMCTFADRKLTESVKPVTEVTLQISRDKYARHLKCMVILCADLSESVRDKTTDVSERHKRCIARIISLTVDVEGSVPLGLEVLETGKPYSSQ
jgi:hypothetical protein